jgi:hypothetical protein
MKKILLLVMIQMLVAGLMSCKSTKQASSLGEMIDVSLYGIVPNSGADQTETIQQLFDKYRTVGSFFFPNGTYIVESLDIYEGIHIQGEDNTWFVKSASSGKWSRMLNTLKYCHKSIYGDRPIIIDNVNFDGNLKEQGEYKKYQLEHQAMMFITGNPKIPNKLKIEIRNCEFKNGVADAISIWKNVDAVIDSVTVTDVFRGAITITGGYTSVRASHVVAGGTLHKTGVDIEVDANGYGGTKATNVHFSDFVLDGDFDVGAIDGGTLLCERIKVLGPPFNIYGQDGSIEIRDSEIHTNKLSSCKVYFPSDLTFKNTSFYTTESPDNSVESGAMLIYWNTGYRSRKDSRVTIDNCVFTFEGRKTGSTINGIVSNADNKERDNLLVVKNTKFKGEFDRNITFRQGGSVELDDVVFDGDIGLSLNSTAKYHYKATIGRLKARAAKTLQVSYRDDKSNELRIESAVERIEAVKGKTTTKIMKTF